MTCINREMARVASTDGSVHQRRIITHNAEASARRPVMRAVAVKSSPVTTPNRPGELRRTRYMMKATIIDFVTDDPKREIGKVKKTLPPPSIPVIGPLQAIHALSTGGDPVNPPQRRPLSCAMSGQRTSARIGARHECNQCETGVFSNPPRL